MRLWDNLPERALRYMPQSHFKTNLRFLLEGQFQYLEVLNMRLYILKHIILMRQQAKWGNLVEIKYRAMSGHVTSGLKIQLAKDKTCRRYIGLFKRTCANNSLCRYSGAEIHAATATMDMCGVEIGRHQLISSVRTPYCLGFGTTALQWHLTCRLVHCRTGSMWLGYC